MNGKKMEKFTFIYNYIKRDPFHFILMKIINNFPFF